MKLHGHIRKRISRCIYHTHNQCCLRCTDGSSCSASGRAAICIIIAASTFFGTSAFPEINVEVLCGTFQLIFSLAVYTEFRRKRIASGLIRLVFKGLPANRNPCTSAFLGVVDSVDQFLTIQPQILEFAQNTGRYEELVIPLCQYIVIYAELGIGYLGTYMFFNLIARIRCSIDVVIRIFIDLQSKVCIRRYKFFSAERSHYRNRELAGHLRHTVDFTGFLVHRHAFRQFSGLDGKSHFIPVIHTVRSNHIGIRHILDAFSKAFCRNLRITCKTSQLDQHVFLSVSRYLQRTRDLAFAVRLQTNLRQIEQFSIAYMVAIQIFAVHRCECAQHIIVFSAYGPVVVQLHMRRIQKLHLQPGQIFCSNIGD